MCLDWVTLLTAILGVLGLSYVTSAVTDFTNEWAVHIPGGLDVAQQVAHNHGYIIERQIEPLEDHYLLKHSQTPRRVRRSITHLTNRLSNDHRVLWVEQQTIKRRAKRSINTRALYTESGFSDPFWPKEWYLRNPESSKYADLYVVPCWGRNLTGRNVVITILDDGIEHTHNDLKRNYDPRASTDLNDKDNDPFPRYDPTNENKHGTRCAGEIAMTSNNGFCGVGIAFNSRIGGVRMLDGPITDSMEAMAIGFNHRYIDIYSVSWGPLDNGEEVDGPGKMASKAFEKSIKEGRDGKGPLYVWASGNGGMMKDNCNCDGYAASIYTISISSVDSTMGKPWYTEKCASIMACTFSGGFSRAGGKVVTSDLKNKCTANHSGTSASAPMAAGIFALLLESNPNLTWRDVQHLVTWTSNPLGLKKNEGWQQNGAGFWVNIKFGFGLLNALELVNAAKPGTWKGLPSQLTCKTNYSGGPKELNSGETIVIKITTDRCGGTIKEINSLEHMKVVLDIAHTQRGTLGIDVVSPQGTRVSLLKPRPKDKSSDGFINWGFMSVHTWGENPLGTWTIIVQDNGVYKNSTGIVKSASLELFGTAVQPEHVRKAGGQRKYDGHMKTTWTPPSRVPMQTKTGKSFSFKKLNSFRSDNSDKYGFGIDTTEATEKLHQLHNLQLEAEQKEKNQLRQWWHLMQHQQQLQRDFELARKQEDLLTYSNDVLWD